MSILARITRFFIRLVNRLAFPAVGFERKRRLAARLPSLPRPPAGTRITRIRIGSVPARWIVPIGPLADGVALYFHGGGWLYGWVFPYDGFTARIARSSRRRILGIDYRLAPEHPFPAALEDCRAAYDWLIARGTAPADIVLMGDSAGANLALALLLSLKADGLTLPRAAVCLSPPTDLSAPGESVAANRSKDVLLSPSFGRMAVAAYAAGHELRDPLVSPYFGELSGLPPLLIQAGGNELLLSDAVRFAAKAKEAGVDATLHVYPGLWHVFALSNPFMPESKRAIREIGEFVRKSMV